jgi:hypothetical protein
MKGFSRDDNKTSPGRSYSVSRLQNLVPHCWDWRKAMQAAVALPAWRPWSSTERYLQVLDRFLRRVEAQM